MAKWKLQYLNKVADSNVQDPVKGFKEKGDVEIQAAAQEVSRGSAKNRALCADASSCWNTGQLLNCRTRLLACPRLTR